MNEQGSKAEIFDVFLCHNSADKPAVREIALELSKEGVKPWLDEEQIRPGTSWQTKLGEQIESINSAAVFVGDAGLGPWQNQESQALLNQFVKRGCPVIPVVLPSAKTAPDLPWMFANLHCVDFRTDSQPLKRLIWGISGQKPAELAKVSVSNKPPTMQEAAPRLIAGGDGEARSDNAISRTRLYPTLAEPPDPDNATQLNILRTRVEEYWVDGVLKHSLNNEVPISLGKRAIDKAVDVPWKYTVEVSETMNSGPLDDRDLSVIYDSVGLLLILGEPGSGKTTTLLDLARMLIDRASDDIKERVAVILNLSSWKKKQPLAEWVSNELSEKYRVPRKIGRFWLQRGYLLPLLDGLDEVDISTQPDCVTAINAFIEKFKPSGLVVCCRLNEYRWLPTRLKLNGAICIESLSTEEVTKYLDAGGSKLATLREAMDTDSLLRELAQSPLMLTIMSLAYQGVRSDELLAPNRDSPDQRRKQIFGFYVEQMFKRKGATSLVFPKEKIIGGLYWLAGEMKEHPQSVFLIEGLQPSWLGTRTKRVAYGTVVALSVGLIFGLIFGLKNELSLGLFLALTILVGVGLGCWSLSPTKNGVITGLIAGLIIGLERGLSASRESPPFGGLGSGLIAGLNGLILGLIAGLISGLGVSSLSHIALVETISWRWNQFWKKTILGSFGGLIFGLIFGLSWGLSYGPWYGLECGLIFGAIFSPIFGVGSGLVGGFTDRVKVGKASPNQGIKLSLKNSLTAFLVAWLIVGLTSGLIVGLGFGLSSSRGFEPLYWISSQMYGFMSNGFFSEQYHRQSSWLHLWLMDQFKLGPILSERLGYGLIDGEIVGFIGGLTVALIVGLNRGGSAVIKHYALRLTLSWKGYTPLNIVGFLDQCAKLILLKKVGGGYIFIHRMLLDYFANLPQPTKDRNGKAKSVQS
jgi:DNA polymerase III delta prime subunit